MASTNSLVFNPTAANQETDAEYLADATRTSGCLDGNGWPDSSANKTLYQLSTYLTALFQAFANKGFTTSDASLSTLTAQCANFLTTADLAGALQVVAWASTLALDAAAYSGFQVTLTGAMSFTISGQVAGQIIALLFIQDATGGRAVTYPGNVKGGCLPDPSANVTSVQLFKVDSGLTLNAIGPMVSVNGQGGLAIGTFGAAPGNFSTLQVAGAAPLGQVLTGDGTHYVPRVGAPVAATRTDKTGIYASGVTYTNSSGSAVFEEVTMAGPGGGATGSDHSLRATINFSVGPSSGIFNAADGYAYIGFWVPSGGTFSVSITDTTGTSTINQWTEVSF